MPLQLAADVAPLVRRAVETGTAFGDSTALLAGVFDRVITLELSPAYAAAARDRFASVDGVEVVEGNSGELLREIADPDVPTFYFLDAHWTGGPAGGEELECPVVEELAALAQRGCDRDVVVIDDVRVFARPPAGHSRLRWPEPRELERLLLEAYPRHRVFVADDQMIALGPRARLRVKRRAAVRRARQALAGRAG